MSLAQHRLSISVRVPHAELLLCIGRKRAQILDSEGERAAEVNIAEGLKRAEILKAEGEAAAIELKAKATAAGVRALASAVGGTGGAQAVSLRIAEQYISAFGQIAKKGNTMLLPSDAGNPATMVAQAMAIYKNANGAMDATSNQQDATNNNNMNVTSQDDGSAYGEAANASTDFNNPEFPDKR